MDGLALLCTLHADGPATLKRLRSAGCANLTALLERPITEVAVALDVAPAAARRLLREARLLAERVGPDLEAEEGPAPVPAIAGPEPLVLELPPVTSAVKLDQGDRALLERIVREGRAALPEADLTHVLTPLDGLPTVAPAPTALERVGLDLSGDIPWPSVAPEAVDDTGGEAPLRAEALQPTAQATPVDAGPDLAPLLALEGVDGSLARDLVELGIHSLDDLARADALKLGRELHVTFAQAKRLCFLARRAVGAPTSSPSAAPQSPGISTRMALPTPVAHVSPALAPSSSSPQPSAARPVWRIEPRTQPLMSALEQHPMALDPLVTASPGAALRGQLPVRVEGHVGGPVVVPMEGPAEVARARFWEPRAGAGAEAQDGSHEPQGVPVDPSEIDRPRRFSDVRRAAARPAEGAAGPRQPALPPAHPAHPASSPELEHLQAALGRAAVSTPVSSNGHAPADAACPGGTVLGWNFEVPRPELPQASEVAPRRTWRPLEPDEHGAAGHGAAGHAADESSAGPFA